MQSNQIRDMILYEVLNLINVYLFYLAKFGHALKQSQIQNFYS